MLTYPDRPDAVLSSVPTTPPETLTIPEVAALMRCHHNSVRNAIKYNGLPAYRVGRGQNGAYRIPRDAFLEWQRKQLEGGHK